MDDQRPYWARCLVVRYNLYNTGCNDHDDDSAPGYHHDNYHCAR